MFITVTNLSLQRVKRVRVNNMHRAAGRWRHGGGIHPSVLSKEEQRRQRCLFIIGLGAGTFLGLRRIFARISQTSPKRVLCNFFLQTLSTKIITTFFGVTSKKGLHMFFCKPWAPFFEFKQRWALFLRGLSGLLPRFSTNQNFWVCACISSPHRQRHCFS